MCENRGVGCLVDAQRVRVAESTSERHDDKRQTIFFIYSQCLPLYFYAFKRVRLITTATIWLEFIG
jgi:hypothetical protein